MCVIICFYTHIYTYTHTYIRHYDAPDSVSVSPSRGLPFSVEPQQFSILFLHFLFSLIVHLFWQTVWGSTTGQNREIYTIATIQLLSRSTYTHICGGGVTFLSLSLSLSCSSLISLVLTRLRRANLLTRVVYNDKSV